MEDFFNKVSRLFEQLKRPVTAIALFGLLAIFLFVLWTLPARIIDKINPLSEIARNIATVLGIIIGGGWTFWVFNRSRTLAGSLIITQTLKEMITLEEKKVSIAIIEVRVKNIGRREVDLEECYINAGVITDDINPLERIFTIGTEPIKENEVNRENRAFPQPIFKDRQPIEPNEETREEIALVLTHSISFSKNPLFRVDVTFKAKKKDWISKEKSWTEKSWTSGAIYKR